MESLQQSSRTSSSFQTDLAACVGGLRAGVLNLLQALGQDVSKSQDVSRALGLDKSVAWKVCRLATSADDFEAAELIPGQRGMRIFFDRAAQAGPPPGALQEARDAFDAFTRMVEEHAGDRVGLAAIVASMRMTGESAADTASMRRAAYRENAILRGVKARARFGAFLLGPGRGDMHTYDSVQIGGVAGLEWLRSESTWTISRRAYGGPAAPLSDDSFVPLDPGGVRDGMPLLSRYSRGQLQLASTTHPTAGTAFQLRGEEIGQKSAVDAFVGWRLKSWADFVKAQPGKLGEYQVAIDLPVEVAQVDLFIHHSLSTSPSVGATLLDTMQEPSGASSVETCPSLPIGVEPFPLGGQDPITTSPHFERYHEMLAEGFEALGTASSEYSGWRTTIEYPPIPSRLALFQHLPHSGS